jgi:hypothetical protein
VSLVDVATAHSCVQPSTSVLLQSVLCSGFPTGVFPRMHASHNSKVATVTAVPRDCDCDDANLPPGHTFVKCHIIFDVKMDLTRKSRYVAGGHMTKPPPSVTHASVVSRESVRIILILAALNGLEVLSSDIQNIYLTAPTKEKIWTTCGTEFGGDDSGKRAVIVRTLYGLRGSGAAF